jgi:lysozyme
MRLSPEGLELLKRFEGFSPCPYICPAGKATIGYGHVIRLGEIFPQIITEQQAEILLLQDVSMAEQGVERALAVRIEQARFDALACLAYNIGVHAFEKSTLLRLVNAGKPEQAALEFDRWVYAGGKKSAGLARRRAEEKALFLS